MTGDSIRFCSHCQLPLPRRRYRGTLEGRELWFCCAGCLTVFHLVGASGQAGRAGWFLAKLGLAAILSGNVMMFQTLLYFGPRQSLDHDALHTASWIMLALSACVYLLLGEPMLTTAWRAARERRLVMEALIGLGALVAIGASAAATLRGDRETYYDSGTMVLVFVVLGQYLDARSRQKATEALPAVAASARRHARVVRQGQEVDLEPEAVAPGERVRVRAGEEIPVDGRVLEGSSDVQQPELTGEPVPRLVQAGDRVNAGSVAADGALTVEASGSSESIAVRIERWTREARSRRARVELAADRLATAFIPGVVLVAALTLAGWGGLRGDWARVPGRQQSGR